MHDDTNESPSSPEINPESLLGDVLNEQSNSDENLVQNEQTIGTQDQENDFSDNVVLSENSNKKEKIRNSFRLLGKVALQKKDVILVKVKESINSAAENRKYRKTIKDEAKIAKEAERIREKEVLMELGSVALSRARGEKIVFEPNNLTDKQKRYAVKISKRANKIQELQEKKRTHEHIYGANHKGDVSRLKTTRNRIQGVVSARRDLKSGAIGAEEFLTRIKATKNTYGFNEDKTVKKINNKIQKKGAVFGKQRLNPNFYENFDNEIDVAKLSRAEEFEANAALLSGELTDEDEFAGYKVGVLRNANNLVKKLNYDKSAHLLSTGTDDGEILDDYEEILEKVVIGVDESGKKIEKIRIKKDKFNELTQATKEEVARTIIGKDASSIEIASFLNATSKVYYADVKAKKKAKH